MAQPSSKANLGYIATPAPVIDTLASWFRFPAGVLALDPCCGDGTALARLMPDDSRTYGIELEIRRAQAARSKLTQVVCSAVQTARVSHQTFGLVLLNPPYDDSTAGRLEADFLRRVIPWLDTGGWLVYIIKGDTYSSAEIRHALVRNFDQFHHFRFPDPWYSGPELAYGQTVLLARRAPRPQDVPVRSIATVLHLDGSLPPLPAAPPGGDLLRVPIGQAPTLFHGGHLTADQAVVLLRDSPLPRVPATSTLQIENPPLPFKQGHLALMLASGYTNGVFHKPPFPPHVAKGTVQRVQHTEDAEDETAGGRAVLLRKETETFAVVVRCAEQSGLIHTVAGAPVVPDTEDND